jgi:hypothetical protein
MAALGSQQNKSGFEQDGFGLRRGQSGQFRQPPPLWKWSGFLCSGKP